jgi:hypothetical protein
MPIATVADDQIAERRRARRKTIRLQALVLLPDDELLTAHTIDLSIGGACLFVSSAFSIGEECRVQMQFQACGASKSVLLIGEVCYCTQASAGFRIGLRFVQLGTETAEFIDGLLL